MRTTKANNPSMRKVVLSVLDVGDVGDVGVEAKIPENQFARRNARLSADVVRRVMKTIWRRRTRLSTMSI